MEQPTRGGPRRNMFASGQVKLATYRDGKGCYYQIATISPLNEPKKAKHASASTNDYVGHAIFRRGASQTTVGELRVTKAEIHEKSDEYIQKIREQSDGEPRKLKINDIVLAKHPNKCWALAVIVEKHYEHDVIKNEEDDELVMDKVFEGYFLEALQQQSDKSAAGPLRFSVQPTQLKHMTITSPCLLNRDGLAIYPHMKEEKQQGLGAKGKIDATLSDLQSGDGAVDVSPEAPKKKPEPKRKPQSKKQEVPNKLKAQPQKEPTRRDGKANKKRTHLVAATTSSESSDPQGPRTTDQNGEEEAAVSLGTSETERPSKRAKPNGVISLVGVPADASSTSSTSRLPGTQSSSVEAEGHRGGGQGNAGDTQEGNARDDTSGPASLESLGIDEILRKMDSYLAAPEGYHALPLPDRLQTLHSWSKVVAGLAAKGDMDAKRTYKFEKLRSKLACLIDIQNTSENVTGISIPEDWLIRYHLSDRKSLLQHDFAFRKTQLVFWLKQYGGWDEDMKVDLALQILEHNKKLQVNEAASKVEWPAELVESVPLRLKTKIRSQYTLGSAQFPHAIGDEDDVNAKAPLADAPWHFQSEHAKAVERYARDRTNGGRY